MGQVQDNLSDILTEKAETVQFMGPVRERLLNEIEEKSHDLELAREAEPWRFQKGRILNKLWNNPISQNGKGVLILTEEGKVSVAPEAVFPISAKEQEAIDKAVLVHVESEIQAMQTKLEAAKELPLTEEIEQPMIAGILYEDTWLNGDVKKIKEKYDLRKKVVDISAEEEDLTDAKEGNPNSFKKGAYVNMQWGAPKTEQERKEIDRAIYALVDGEIQSVQKRLKEIGALELSPSEVKKLREIRYEWEWVTGNVKSINKKYKDTQKKKIVDISAEREILKSLKKAEPWRFQKGRILNRHWDNPKMSDGSSPLILRKDGQIVVSPNAILPIKDSERSVIDEAIRVKVGREIKAIREKLKQTGAAPLTNDEEILLMQTRCEMNWLTGDIKKIKAQYGPQRRTGLFCTIER